MKIHVEIDITPEEVRRLMGLPDLEPFQRQLLEDLRERIAAGAEGYDPLALMQPYLRSGLAGMEMLQRLLGAGLGAAAPGPKADGD